MGDTEKVVVVGAGPVGSLAALYAASRGHAVEIYELRNGQFSRASKLLTQASFVTCASHFLLGRGAATTTPPTPIHVHR
jgi:kynurenine 3-monooxygenase